MTARPDGATARVGLGGAGPAAWGLLLWGLLHLVCFSLLADLGRDIGIDPAYRKVHQVVVGLEQGQDSWKAMLPAYAHVESHGGDHLYTAVFFDGQRKFQYPPTSLLIFPLFEALGIGRASWPLALLGISYAFFVAFVGAMVALLREALTQFGGRGVGPGAADRWLFAVATVLACVTFYPVTQSLGNGQAQLWITALAGLALWAWLVGRRGWAGGCLALAALLKPHFGLLLVWGLVRRQWAFAAAFGGVLLGALALSVWWFGLASHLNYLDTTRFLARHGEAFWTNQSLAGTLHRMVADVNEARWFPPFHAGIYAASIAFGGALVAAAVVLPARGGRGGGVTDLGIMLATVVLASPIAWRHHYGLFLPLFALLFAAAVAPPGMAWPRWALLAGAYLATGTFWRGAGLLAGTPLNVLNSLCFAGGLVVLGLLYELNRRGAAGPGEVSR